VLLIDTIRSWPLLSGTMCFNSQRLTFPMLSATRQDQPGHNTVQGTNTYYSMRFRNGSSRAINLGWPTPNVAIYIVVQVYQVFERGRHVVLIHGLVVATPSSSAASTLYFLSDQDQSMCCNLVAIAVQRSNELPISIQYACETTFLVVGGYPTLKTLLFVTLFGISQEVMLYKRVVYSISAFSCSVESTQYVSVDLYSVSLGCFKKNNHILQPRFLPIKAHCREQQALLKEKRSLYLPFPLGPIVDLSTKAEPCAGSVFLDFSGYSFPIDSDHMTCQAQLPFLSFISSKAKGCKTLLHGESKIFNTLKCLQPQFLFCTGSKHSPGALELTFDVSSQSRPGVTVNKPSLKCCSKAPSNISCMDQLVPHKRNPPHYVRMYNWYRHLFYFWEVPNEPPSEAYSNLNYLEKYQLILRRDILQLRPNSYQTLLKNIAQCLNLVSQVYVSLCQQSYHISSKGRWSVPTCNKYVMWFDQYFQGLMAHTTEAFLLPQLLADWAQNSIPYVLSILRMGFDHNFKWFMAHDGAALLPQIVHHAIPPPQSLIFSSWSRLWPICSSAIAWSLSSPTSPNYNQSCGFCHEYQFLPEFFCNLQPDHKSIPDDSDQAMDLNPLQEKLQLNAIIPYASRDHNVIVLDHLLKDKSYHPYLPISNLTKNSQTTKPLSEMQDRSMWEFDTKQPCFMKASEENQPVSIESVEQKEEHLVNELVIGTSGAYANHTSKWREKLGQVQLNSDHSIKDLDLEDVIPDLCGTSIVRGLKDGERGSRSTSHESDKGRLSSSKMVGLLCTLSHDTSAKEKDTFKAKPPNAPNPSSLNGCNAVAENIELNIDMDGMLPAWNCNVAIYPTQEDLVFENYQEPLETSPAPPMLEELDYQHCQLDESCLQPFSALSGPSYTDSTDLICQD